MHLCENFGQIWNGSCKNKRPYKRNHYTTDNIRNKNKERITPLHRTFESKKYAITKPIKFDIKIDITAKIKVNTTE